jgi:cytochrome c oxidase cbb3-type subunit III
MRPKTGLAALAFLLLATITVRLPAQTPPPQQPPPTPPAGTPQTPATPGQGRGRGPGTFPAQQRPLADPAVLAKGRGMYDVYCRACHGADLRGGDQGGPNLLRSPVALNDSESIGPVIKEGRQTPGMPVMPPLPLPDDDIKAIAAYIRSVLASASRQGGPPEGPPIKLNILVGDPAAGEKYFAARCSTCHSPTGDLKGIATKVSEPMQLQNHWVSGGRGGRGGAAPASRAITATVTTPAGERVEGRLVRMDDFIVVVAGADGLQRSFRRDGDVPKIELRDPLEGHKKLLLEYTDTDIHNVTAYLATLK